MGSSAKTIEKDEPVEVDLIIETVREIGALDKEDAFEAIPVLLESVDFSYFKLGGVLSAIQDNDWWQDSGYAKFKEFIPGEFGLHYRKGYYLIEIYNNLVEAEIPWYKVSDLGWTKLKELSSILTQENVDEWVEKAESLSVLQLKEAVKAFSDGLSSDGTTDPDSSGVSTITFIVHPDQKETINQAVEQAQEEADTDFKGVALEAICMNYLAGGSTKEPAKPLSLKATMEKYSMEQIFEVIEVLYPEIDVKVEY